MLSAFAIPLDSAPCRCASFCRLPISTSSLPSPSPSFDLRFLSFLPHRCFFLPSGLSPRSVASRSLPALVAPSEPLSSDSDSDSDESPIPTRSFSRCVRPFLTSCCTLFAFSTENRLTIAMWLRPS